MIEHAPPPNHEESEPWLQQIRQQLDDSARDLDAATLSRLNQARQRALTGLQSPPTPRVWPWLALATSAAIAWMAWLTPGATLDSSSATPMALESVEDFELLSEDGGLALYSDLEFYAWLDSQDAGG